jgi:tetratricopeptide (TPR) repeat protein
VRLSIPIPSSWPVTRRRGRRLAVVPGAADPDQPDLLVEWEELELLPDDQRAWVQATLRRDLAPTAALDVGADETTTTASGWPLRLVEAAVLGSDGAVLERRLVAFYAFFEHAATAMLRGLSTERFEAERDRLRDILVAAAPDWRESISALSQLWDVAPTGQKRTAREPRPVEGLARAAHDSGGDAAALAGVLAEVIEAIDSGDGDLAALELLRGRLLRRLGQLDEALAALGRALDRGADASTVQYSIALTLTDLGRLDEAIAAWRQVADAEPEDIDALYNIGIARYTSGDHGRALAAWNEAFERAPDDFWVARKIVQAQHALGRHDAAAATRDRLLEIWRGSRDPAVRLADEFVFDQFEVAGVAVLASETLQPIDPSTYPIYVFRAESDPPVSVQIETSDYARERGVPFVISRLGRSGYKALGTSESLPPYPELRATVEKLLAEELVPRPTIDNP